VTEKGHEDFRVREILERYFNVIDMYLHYELTRYYVTPKGTGDHSELLKANFKNFVDEIRGINHLAKLSTENGMYLITPFKIPEQGRPNYNINIILLLITFATVFYDGYLRSSMPILTEALMPGISPYINAFLFSLSILGIFGLHELGHKYATSLQGTSASMPYFLPAPPGMGGTFGAIITQREPPVNRDSLFDMGFSGPFVGFIVTIVVTVIGVWLSWLVTPEQIVEWSHLFPQVELQSITVPRLLEYTYLLMYPNVSGHQLMLHPIAFAAWVGCLVTFLNLIPAWQLDGGHIGRALIGKKYHREISFISLLIMAAAGYVLMAVIVGIMMLRTDFSRDSLLDEISPLSKSRKALIIFYLLMFILTSPV
jgi:membrane-associated protease RseP (regulator of RpoE activity)